MDGNGARAGEARFNVGGVALARPFKIRRLGHFGFNVADVEASRRFYTEVLGFRVSDPLDFAEVLPDKKITQGLDQTVGYFMRHGGDHHSFVVFPKPLMDRLAGGHAPADVTTNQITWQVGSLREVNVAIDWFEEHGIVMPRRGRDMPGSNWHTYPVDPEGHINEIYYGIEQIGWDGLSKPAEARVRGFHVKPELPQISEFAEVEQFRAAGMDLASGCRSVETREARYDVGGVMLARPFKIVRIGPVRLFVDDVDAMLAFYRDRLGLAVTEEVTWERHRCVFLRANTEHHSIALYPRALRDVLGLSAHTTCLSFGLQVADYQQLRDAVDFVEREGSEVCYLPPELSPGIDYSAFIRDPDGHALQLYYYMEQVGWDGKPRPARKRPRVAGDWPDTVEPQSDTFAGEAFLGPWG